MRELLETIYQRNDLQACTDLKNMCREVIKSDVSLGIEYIRKLSDKIEDIMREGVPDTELLEWYRLHEMVCLTGAPYDFHCYLLYIEWDREPSKKFYVPRKKVLKQVVDALQELADDKLDLLAISLPPGVLEGWGKNGVSFNEYINLTTRMTQLHHCYGSIYLWDMRLM